MILLPGVLTCPTMVPKSAGLKLSSSGRHDGMARAVAVSAGTCGFCTSGTCWQSARPQRAAETKCAGRLLAARAPLLLFRVAASPLSQVRAGREVPPVGRHR